MVRYAWLTHPTGLVGFRVCLIDLGHVKSQCLCACFMPNYRRPRISGGTYFITQVTHQRHPWLCTDTGRKALREAIIAVRQKLVGCVFSPLDTILFS